MVCKKTAIFDTSGLNRLFDDHDRDCLVAGLSAGYRVCFTGNNISEIIATGATTRRTQLLDFCLPFLSAGGMCLQPFNSVIQRVCAPFDPRAVAPLSWRLVDVRFRESEQEMVRREFIDDELSAEERITNRKLEAEFKGIFDNPREHFQKLFENGGEMRPAGLAELVSRLQDGGAFWTIAKDLYERGAEKDALDDDGIRKLLRECPPFHALMLAYCMAQYEGCIRDFTQTPVSYRAGRVDLLSAVFLPYCDVFITSDERQNRCFVEIESVGKFGAEIVLYDAFKSSLTLTSVIGA